MATYSNAVKKVYQIYFSKLGTILETFGDTHLNAQDDEVAVIKAFIEDGVVDNVTTLVNFTPEGRTAFTSHWFPMFYRGLQEKIVSGEAEPRTFAQFEITLPSIVLLMNGGKTSVSQSMTVIQRYGSIHLGNFATITDLNTDNPASETYFDDSVVAFVYSNEAGQTDQVGFYQVEEVEEVWTWVLKTTLLYALSTKQYNGATFTVGRGPSNPQGVPTVSQSLIYQLMQEISYLDIGYQSLDVDMTDLQDKVEALRDGSLPIEFDNLDTNLVAVEVEQAIKEVNTKSNVNIQDINDIVSGQKAFTEILLSDGDGGEARLTYDGTDPILSYRGITGEMFKNLFLEVEPASGVTFSNGMNVMYAGSIGGSGKRLAKPTVLSELAVNPSLYLGMITQVTTDGYGVVNWYGVVNSLNTSGLTLGADVYVGDGGAFTTVKPISPLPQIEIGLIERVNPANGAISLRPNVGRYLNGLHDVYTNSHTFVGGETIMFNITTNRYEVYDLKGNILRIDTDIDTLQEDVLALENNKVPKTTTIIGLDLQDNILIGEFRTALGNATQSVAGLLSAEDKTHLDGLVALLENSDGDTIVDTIGEILAIFQNYPEGADLVTVLQGKVDKVVDKDLSTNDFTDLLKAKLDSLLDGTQYYDKTYIDSLKDQNGWESELITLTPLTNGQTVSTATLLTFNSLRLQVKDTSTSFVDTDTVEVSLGVVTGNKIQLSDTTVYLEIGVTNSTFTAPAGWELQIVGLKYTDLVASDVSFDNVTSGLDAENVQEAIDELQDEKVDKTAIVNDLTIGGATDVLSAEQGKQLKIIVDGLDDDIEALDERVDILESKIDVIGLDYKEYGIREVVGQSASEFERVTRFWGEVKLGSATGLVANVAIDDAVVANSFDYIPIFKREKVSIEATDLSSNVVSNTFVKVPKYYIKEEWTTESGIDYHYYFVSQFKHDGYRLPLPFKREDGSERDYAYMGAYEAYLDGNNKLRSLTGQIPKISYSRNNFRTAARALDGLGVNSKYQITDLAEYVDLVQIPFMIEFATKHSQGVFLGATSMAYSASHTAIADGTAVNFIVVSNATGAAFVLGQTVSIGTSNGNDSVAKDRIVTQIDVDTPNAGETTITFDGAAVNIAIGNVIASRAWKTGMTDNVKVSGSHALNDGKHSIVWRGLENPFGNILKNVDGVKISNWRGYVAENPKDYNDTASVAGVYAEPYLPLGYLNANANNYAQDLGYDANYPYAKFPISVQASSGLFFRDYYYQNSGDITVFVGGFWSHSSSAGLFFWALYYVLGSTHFIIGARLSYRP